MRYVRLGRVRRSADAGRRAGVIGKLAGTASRLIQIKDSGAANAQGMQHRCYAENSMITPAELRWQAERLLAEAENAGEFEKTILLELASKLRQTASALEGIEGYGTPSPPTPRSLMSAARSTLAE